MIKFGGLEKTSLLDYPNKISAIIFTYGCNLRCPYCHNPELVIEALDERREIPEKYILKFLKTRIGKLDAVVITGGEPLIYEGLEDLIVKIKEMGYLVKLDTNGFFPKKLKKIIDMGILDYIAMDVKYPKSQYIKISGKKNAFKKITESIDYIMNSSIDYEFRTTYVKGFHDLESAEAIGKMLIGAKRYYIQNFREGKTINPSLNSSNSFSDKELKQILKSVKPYVRHSYIR
ncbi:MAG: anaerobic ribonucleoside-triphosphate reductase activating protein [Candidatus Dojkabacteria bacterium]